MFRSMITVAMLFALLTGSAFAAPAPPTVLSQDVSVTLLPAKNRLTGTSTLMLNLMPGSQVNLKMSPRTQITSVTLDGTKRPYTFDNGIFSTIIPDCQDKVKTTRLEIEYSCTFNDPIPERIVSFENPDFGVTGVISPKGVFLDGSAGWYPATAEPPERMTVTITAPEGIEAITQGKRLSRSTIKGKTFSVWETHHPARDLAISAGPYRVDETKLGTIDIYTYFSKENQELAKGYLDAVREYLQLYQDLLGPYPFEKFAVVENFLPTGYGYPSYTLLGSNVIRLPFIKTTSLPHEIVHCWWGNGVLVDYAKGNWSEGLATYLADYLLEERKSPQAGRAYRLKILADYAALVGTGKDLSLREFVGRHDQATRAVGYGKGAMVFHMARKIIGDKAFFEALRVVAKDHMFQEVSWDDFVKQFSATSKRNVANQLLPVIDNPGAPQLGFAVVKYSLKGDSLSVSGNLDQMDIRSSVPVPLRLETDKGVFDRTLALSSHRTLFNMMAEGRPQRLMIDPDADIFRLLSPAEIPPAVNRLKGSEVLTVVLTDSCKADRSTISLLLESLGKKNAPVITEAAVTSQDISDRDFILCGIPTRSDLQLKLPDYINVAKDSFTVNGERFDTAGHLLLAISTKPDSPERLTALFLPLSREAATSGTRKITHYGPYGYLVFDNGEIRKKGQIEAQGGNSVYLFSDKK